ncbi:hypothetical protein FDECE_14983 [Fusarium decemcellulare]|nr:hypothetical protein FDECE_14983 [Fusarium decemcellulare]
MPFRYQPITNFPNPTMADTVVPKVTVDLSTGTDSVSSGALLVGLVGMIWTLYSKIKDWKNAAQDKKEKKKKERDERDARPQLQDQIDTLTRAGSRLLLPMPPTSGHPCLMMILSFFSAIIL